MIVEVEDPLSEEMIEITRARWGSHVRLRFAPGSRMIEQQSPIRAYPEHPLGGRAALRVQEHAA